jgi:small multidrug resistance pump
MTGYIYLVIAIAAEVIATTAMKALDGFNKPLPLVLVVLGYATAIGLLSQVVKTIPVGIAYAIWSGMGIVLVSVATVFIYKQKLDFAAMAGMGLIIAGVIVIQLFSKSTGH